MLSPATHPTLAPEFILEQGQKLGLAYMGGAFLTPAEASRVIADAPHSPHWYTLHMPITAPRFGPPLRLTLAPLLADREGGNILMANDPSFVPDPRNPAAKSLHPSFSGGAAAFLNLATEGVQTIMDAVLSSRNGNLSEIAAHLENRLRPIAAEHLDKKLAQPALVAVVSFVRGAFSVLPLV